MLYYRSISDERTSGDWISGGSPIDGEQMTADSAPATAGGAVLITGASRGIGAASAVAVARNGFDIAIGCLEREEEAADVAEAVRSFGRRAVVIQADVSDPAQARRLVSQAEESLGPLFGLVNNAGIMPETAFLEIDVAEWDKVIATDLSALFHTTQAAIPGMVDRGAGAIVNVSSRLGQIGCAGVVPYATAKAGVLGFTKSLAREFGPAGIRVNAVAPGITLTAMSADMATGDMGRRRLAELPAGRFNQPEDVAASVAFLLSDDAASFHGQTLCPNGGGHMP